MYERKQQIQQERIEKQKLKHKIKEDDNEKVDEETLKCAPLLDSAQGKKKNELTEERQAEIISSKILSKKKWFDKEIFQELKSDLQSTMQSSGAKQALQAKFVNPLKQTNIVNDDMERFNDEESDQSALYEDDLNEEESQEEMAREEADEEEHSDIEQRIFINEDQLANKKKRKKIIRGGAELNAGSSGP